MIFPLWDSFFSFYERTGSGSAARSGFTDMHDDLLAPGCAGGGRADLKKLVFLYVWGISLQTNWTLYK